MDIQYRHSSTGDMYPRHRFELHYDQHSYRPNRPVNARLHQFAHTGSMPSSPQQRMMFPQELAQMSSGAPAGTAAPMRSQHSPRQSPHSSMSVHRELSRSVSMPMLQDPHQYTTTHDSCAPQRHSRKNSLVSNCTHSSREHSVSSEMAIGSDDDGEARGEHNCHRHHHRRGSVAIKFEEKKVVEGWTPTKDMHDAPGEKLQEGFHFNEEVFEGH